MQVPPTTRNANFWIGRIANWNRFVAGELAFLLLGLLQTALLTPVVIDLFYHETKVNWWAGSPVACLFALPTAITALCLAGVAVEACGLVEAGSFAEARQSCRSCAGVLLFLHGVPIFLAGCAWGFALIPISMALDLGFQASILLFLWSQWLPRNEMEKHLNSTVKSEKL